MSATKNMEVACHICSIKFSSDTLFNDHLQTVEHQQQALIKTVSHSTTIKQNLDPTAVHHCDVCNVNVSGIIPYRQHLEGQKHYKKVKNLMLMEAIKKMEGCSLNDINGGKQDNVSRDIVPHDVQRNNSAEEKVEDELDLNLSSAKCDTWSRTIGDSKPSDKSNDNDDGFVSDLASSNCDFMDPEIENPADSKEESSGKEEDNKFTKSPLILSSRVEAMLDRKLGVSSRPAQGQSNVHFPYSCPACATCFTGPEPYQQHLVSAKHAKKVGSLPTTSESPACEVCRMTFNGHIPYMQHLESAKHQKQLQYRQGILPGALYQVSRECDERIGSAQLNNMVAPPSTSIRAFQTAFDFEDRFRSSSPITVTKVDEPFVFKKTSEFDKKTTLDED